MRVDSFECYRVDNLRLNPDVVKGVVKPIGTKGDAPRMQLPEIKHALESGWYGEKSHVKPPCADEYISHHEGMVRVSPLHGANEVEANLRNGKRLSELLDDVVYLLPRINNEGAANIALRNKYMPQGIKEGKNPDYGIWQNLGCKRIII